MTARLPPPSPNKSPPIELVVMLSFRFSKFSVLPLLYSLAVSSLAIAQQRGEEIRPRRTKSEPEIQQPAATSTTKTAVTTDAQWKVPERSIVNAAATTRLTGPEPLMRIALATDVRAASVSTTSRLLSSTDPAQTYTALDVGRVRIESHVLAPLPPTEETFAVKVNGLPNRADAESKARAIKEATSDQSQIVLDVETQTWGLLVGPRRSRDAAEIAQMRLEDAGYPATVVDLSPPSSTVSDQAVNTATSSVVRTAITPTAPIPIPTRSVSNPNVRLASRSSIATRELIASNSANGKLFSSSAPVLFASDDEGKAPVRFNEKPYRGRIEVFANTHGLLTVVNVIGLEDYVRGVVANELSPGGFPAIEALKAQAIAARTYAVRNRGQFMSQGFDLLPTTRSQVYRGLTSEQPLSTRAVDETRGLIATYGGEPINALYTSTCGGRTEDASNIFNEEVPYLHGRECSIEGRNGLASFMIKSGRELAEVREEQNVQLARLVAELSVHAFSSLSAHVSDSWLNEHVAPAEVRSWLGSVASLTHQTLTSVPEDVTRPPQFATALSAATFGESRADTLLNNTDVDYFLAVKDAADVPAANRADVAMLIRDGYLPVFPDASLRPKEVMTRGRVVRTIARLLESRGLLQMQKGTARPAADNTLILRSAKGKDQPLHVSPDVYLFRQIGDGAYQVRSVALVGGEPINFHVNASGLVDYLDVRPAPGGAAADRFSSFSSWTSELTPGEVRARLGRYATGVGSVVDLRVVSRGTSRRVTDLEVIGNEGVAHVRGGRIRSALGLREQLFVIDKKFDSDGRVASFVFTGRGWGHGVGMCQVGAYGLARQGFSYEQILKAYYTGIELTKMY